MHFDLTAVNSVLEDNNPFHTHAWWTHQIGKQLADDMQLVKDSQSISVVSSKSTGIMIFVFTSNIERDFMLDMELLLTNTHYITQSGTNNRLSIYIFSPKANQDNDSRFYPGEDRDDLYYIYTC